MFTADLRPSERLEPRPIGTLTMLSAYIQSKWILGHSHELELISKSGIACPSSGLRVASKPMRIVSGKCTWGLAVKWWSSVRQFPPFPPPSTLLHPRHGRYWVNRLPKCLAANHPPCMYLAVWRKPTRSPHPRALNAVTGRRARCATQQTIARM